MAQAEKMKLTSLDIAEQKREQLKLALKELLPEAAGENGIDFDQLKRALGAWVEPGKERFGLQWPGKADCMKIIQQPSVATLKPAREESVNFDETENLFIEGDNLEVLKLLQKSYFGKVKMIYIDPPYNTGNDFIYPDNFAENLDTYLAYTGQVDESGKKFATNTDAVGRYHSRWLNMMYPRLYLGKNLLRDDGAIFISIDDTEVANLRKICDEIFGEENFIANVVWQKKYAVSNDDPGIAPMHDHIIVYQKTEEFRRNLLPRTEKQLDRYKNLDNDPRGVWSSDNYVSNKSRYERPTLWYPIIHPKTGKEVWPDENAVWRYSKDKHLQIEKENRLYWGPDLSYEKPRIKRFLTEIQDGVVPSTWWEFKEVGHNDEGQKETGELLGKKIFSTPKPVRLLKRILEISTSKGEPQIVLDFFAGSASLAQAVIELNKADGRSVRYVLVQLPEKIEQDTPAAEAGYKTIADIGKERIRRAAKKISTEGKGQLDLNSDATLDLGFKVFKLDRSNFKVWEGSVEQIQNLEQQLSLHVDHIAKASTPEDILYELLLKSGFPLNTKVEKLKMAGKEVFSIEEGALLICLDKELTQPLIDALAEANPLQVICLDEGFKGNDQLKANAVQTFKARAQAEESEIVFKTV
jgi:adenine-specific DNA-methyltransferase